MSIRARRVLVAVVGLAMTLSTSALAVQPSTQAPTLRNQSPTVGQLTKGRTLPELAVNRPTLLRAAVYDQVRAVVASDRALIGAGGQRIAVLRAQIRAARAESKLLPRPTAVDAARRRGEATPYRTLRWGTSASGSAADPKIRKVAIGGEPVGPIDAKYVGFQGRHATVADLKWLNHRAREAIAGVQQELDGHRSDLTRDRAELVRAGRELRAATWQKVPPPPLPAAP